MNSKTMKSTSSGYKSPEIEVVGMQTEGIFAASLEMTNSIGDMEEWEGWE